MYPHWQKSYKNNIHVIIDTVGNVPFSFEKVIPLPTPLFRHKATMKCMICLREIMSLYAAICISLCSRAAMW